MPAEQRFAEARKELEQSGWRLARIRGSHHIFEKPGNANLVIPVHQGKVKPAYVRKIKKTIEGN
jgi:predicted RNA binding protein YcfA (HicA-like mRNA interferase family)